MEGRGTADDIPAGLMEVLRGFQKGEMTEYTIYRMLAASVRDAHNKAVLGRIAEEERNHYRIWKEYTGVETGPEMIRVWFYYLLARFFGITFGIKLMERRENAAIHAYQELIPYIPDAREILADEEHHELEIIGLLNEERLKYVSSIVLGLNDALVEFTGSLAGFTFALQDTRIIAAVGFIMGIAASLSMAASEYLSQKSEASGQIPFKAAGYTGVSYIITVVILVLPFLLIGNPFIALFVTLAAAIAIIIFFTFYTSVAGDLPFLRRFVEMAAISLGIAGISFIIGLLVRSAFQVEV